jgi:hypothetical protein
MISAARKNLEKDGHLVAFAMVGNSMTDEVIPVGFGTGSEEEKDKAAHFIRIVAHQIKANFVLLIVDAWGLPKEKMKDYQKILSIYGSVAASPYRVDTVGFILETKAGTWFSQVEQKKHGLSNKKKTFGEVKFLQGQGDGRFANLLEPLDKA